jgi:hypothetical protein
MVKKQSKGLTKGSKGSPKGPQVNKKNFTPPESWTGYPAKKPCNCPVEQLGKTAGGGKSAG